MSSRIRGLVSRGTLAWLCIAAALAAAPAFGALDATSALAHPRHAARACARRPRCRATRRAQAASGRRLARERRRLERLARRRARAHGAQAQQTSPTPAPAPAGASAAPAPASTSAAPAPTVTPPPAPPTVTQTSSEDPNLQPGLVSGTNMKEDLQGSVLLGAKLVRIGFSIAATAAELEPVIGGYAAAGIRVQPLAEFYDRVPSAAEAKNLASWARAFGPGGSFWAGRAGTPLPIEAIEFGNETASESQYGDSPGSPSFMARAETYAVRFKEAAEAIAASGKQVGLLAQDEDTTGDWMKGMYTAVPQLTRYVTGWTIHPYGGEQYNRERLEALIAQTAEHGAATIPIDITEWGVSTDNGHCVNFNEGFNLCMSYEEAAQVMKSTVAWIGEMLGDRLGDFFLYQVRDQQPAGASSNCQDYYGVLQHELQPKGAYTEAARELLDA